jgi:hypothetical protein
MEIMPLPEDGTERWPAPLMQSAAAARALSVGRVAVMDAGAVVAEVVMLRRMGVGAVLRGPVWGPEVAGPARVAALRALRRAGVRLVEAEDAETALSLHAAGFRQVATAAHVAEWHLLGDGAARRRAMEGTWRNRLVFAEKAGLRVEVRRLAGPDDPLLRAEAAQRRARRYRALPVQFAAGFGAAARVVEARQAGETVAAMLFLCHGRTATYHIGHTTPAGRACEAHRLLIWQMAQRLAAEGVGRLDLGPLDTETTPGLARFKLGTGARARVLGGSFVAVPLM